jgi:hypothetical protein
VSTDNEISVVIVAIIRLRTMIEEADSSGLKTMQTLLLQCIANQFRVLFEHKCVAYTFVHSFFLHLHRCYLLATMLERARKILFMQKSSR